jgi:flap endonuclease-1
MKAYDKMENAETEEERIKYLKRTVSISKIQWQQCKDLLTMMGIPFIQAPEEADSQCAYLAKNGFVDAVFTEDMDILTFGSPKIVRNLTSHKVESTEIVLDDILKNLELNQDQFIDFCILLGSDYSSGITNIKPDVILNYYKKHTNIKDTIEHMKKDNINIPNDFNYEETKNYFLNPTILEVSNETFKLKKPDNIKLLKNLVDEYGFLKYLIKTKLDRLESYYIKFKII